MEINESVCENLQQCDCLQTLCFLFHCLLFQRNSLSRVIYPRLNYNFFFLHFLHNLRLQIAGRDSFKKPASAFVHYAAPCSKAIHLLRQQSVCACVCDEKACPQIYTPSPPPPLTTLHRLTLHLPASLCTSLCPQETPQISMTTGKTVGDTG